jgi:hypothetical protein
MGFEWYPKQVVLAARLISDDSFRLIVPPLHLWRASFRFFGKDSRRHLNKNGNVEVVFTRDDEGRLLRRRGRANLNPKPSTDSHSLFLLTRRVSQRHRPCGLGRK